MTRLPQVLVNVPGGRTDARCRATRLAAQVRAVPRPSWVTAVGCCCGPRAPSRRDGSWSRPTTTRIRTRSPSSLAAAVRERRVRLINAAPVAASGPPADPASSIRGLRRCAASSRSSRVAHDGEAVDRSSALVGRHGRGFADLLAIDPAVVADARRGARRRTGARSTADLRGVRGVAGLLGDPPAPTERCRARIVALSTISSPRRRHTSTTRPTSPAWNGSSPPTPRCSAARTRSGRSAGTGSVPPTESCALTARSCRARRVRRCCSACTRRSPRSTGSRSAAATARGSRCSSPATVSIPAIPQLLRCSPSVRDGHLQQRRGAPGRRRARDRPQGRGGDRRAGRQHRRAPRDAIRGDELLQLGARSSTRWRASCSATPGGRRSGSCLSPTRTRRAPTSSSTDRRLRSPPRCSTATSTTTPSSSTRGGAGAAPGGHHRRQGHPDPAAPCAGRRLGRGRRRVPRDRGTAGGIGGHRGHSPRRPGEIVAGAARVGSGPLRRRGRRRVHRGQSSPTAWSRRPHRYLRMDGETPSDPDNPTASRGQVSRLRARARRVRSRASGGAPTTARAAGARGRPQPVPRSRRATSTVVTSRTSCSRR